MEFFIELDFNEVLGFRILDELKEFLFLGKYKCFLKFMAVLDISLYLLMDIFLACLLPWQIC